MLEQTKIFPTFDEALEFCNLKFGTMKRSEGGWIVIYKDKEKPTIIEVQSEQPDKEENTIDNTFSVDEINIKELSPAGREYLRRLGVEEGTPVYDEAGDSPKDQHRAITELHEIGEQVKAPKTGGLNNPFVQGIIDEMNGVEKEKPEPDISFPTNAHGQRKRRIDGQKVDRYGRKIR